MDWFIQNWINPITELLAVVIVIATVVIGAWYRARLETSEKISLFLICIIYLSIFLHYFLGMTGNMLWRNIAARAVFILLLTNLVYRVRRRKPLIIITPIENQELLKQIASFREISENDGETVIEFSGILGDVIEIKGKDLKVEVIEVSKKHTNSGNRKFCDEHNVRLDKTGVCRKCVEEVRK